MSNLDKFKEITDLNFDGENPHLAICHKSQSYSANGRPDALLFKGQKPQLTTEILKSLGKVCDEEELQKMSMANKRDALTAALTVALEGNTDCCYSYAYIADFSEDMVAFYFDESLYAVAYTEDETGKITFSEEPVKATRKELYVESETGQELIKALDFNKTEIKPEEEEIVTDNVEDKQVVEGEEVQKSVSDQVQELLKAEREELMKSLREEIKAEAEEAELQKSTTELVKGFAFVAEDEADLLVKSLIACEGEAGVAILKALESASQEVVKAKEEVEAAKAEAEEVKKEFGTVQKGKEGTPAVSNAANAGAERTNNLAAFMKSRNK